MSTQNEARNYVHKPALYIFVSASYLLLAFIPPLLLDNNAIDRLTMEDGFYESVGAVFWLVASVLFFYLFATRRDLKKQRFLTKHRNVFFLLLGVLFFLAFGEEISWGQRFFGFQTPELLDEINAQGELNIHNLQIFHGKTAEGQDKGFIALMTNIDRLFSVFWFTYCLLVPIAYKNSVRVKKTLNRISLPIIPIWIGVFFMLNYLISKVFEWSLQSVVEIKEHNFAYLFVVVAVWFVWNYKSYFEQGGGNAVTDA